MKTVTYKGQVFTVPEWAKFIAADADGQVYVYDDKPECLPNGTYSQGNGKMYYIGDITVKPNKLKEIK